MFLLLSCLAAFFNFREIRAKPTREPKFNDATLENEFRSLNGGLER